MQINPIILQLFISEISVSQGGNQDFIDNSRLVQFKLLLDEVRLKPNPYSSFDDDQQCSEGKTLNSLFCPALWLLPG